MSRKLNLTVKVSLFFLLLYPPLLSLFRSFYVLDWAVAHYYIPALLVMLLVLAGLNTEALLTAVWNAAGIHLSQWLGDFRIAWYKVRISPENAAEYAGKVMDHRGIFYWMTGLVLVAAVSSLLHWNRTHPWPDDTEHT